VKASVSPRVLIWTVVLLVLGGALGAGGYWAYLNFYQTPENLYTWADKAYRKAEATTDRGDKKKHLDYADGYLIKMLEKDPKSDKAYMFRYRVRNQLYLLTKEEEDKRGDKEHEKSSEYNASATQALLRAIELNKKNLEAVATALNISFAEDNMAQAEPFAENLAQYKYEPPQKDLPNFDMWLAAAHYVLARQALAMRPPRPDDALAELNEIKEIPTTKPPRWREIGLETKALMLKADEAKKPGAKQPGADKPSNDAEQQLARKVPEWLQRARTELDAKDVEGNENNPAAPKILYNVHPTNVRGLLDFLVLAIALAPTKEDLVERVNLLKRADDKALSYAKTPASVKRAVSNGLAELPLLLERQSQAKKLNRDEWDDLNKSIKEISDKARDSGAPVAPEAYLQLAARARAEKRYDDAYKLLEDGLEAAKASKLPANASDAAKEQRQATIQKLHTEAAWLALLRNNREDAEKHLLIMREHKSMAPWAHLVEGLDAVNDGRLEEGIRHLLAARQDVRIARTLYPQLGLAVAYMGLQQFENARPLLLQLEGVFKRYDKLSAEEKLVARSLLRDPDELDRLLLRCYLGLNMSALAMPYKERLENKPDGVAARLLLIDYYRNLARTKLAEGDKLDARDAFDAARNEMDTALKLHPDDPSLVWTDAMLLADRPEINPALVANAAAALVASPSDTPQQAAAAAQLAKGLNWNAEKAEQRLAAYAARKKDLASATLWYNWLVMRQRLAEANDVLVRMEKDNPDRAHELKQVRAQIALARRDSAEVGRLVKSLRAEKPGPDVDALAVLNLLLKNDNSAARKVLDALVSKQESNLQYHDWRAKLALASGDFAEAARSFGRCLGHTQYRTGAEYGVVLGLLYMAAKETPKAAAELAEKLLRDHPNDPALLLASAELARLLDNIEGPYGMEARLKGYEALLRGLPGVSPANGPDRLARGWNAARRLDLARREVERALKSDPSYVPALMLAVQLAAADEDWNTCLDQSTSLIALLAQRAGGRGRAEPPNTPQTILDMPEPFLSDAMFWRGLALEQLERPEDARLAYQELLNRYPELSTGYLGLARLREKVKDYDGALKLVRRWRDREPNDLDGIQQALRLLVLAGKTEEAKHTADQFLDQQISRLKKAQTDLIAKRPAPKDDKEKELWAASDKYALALRERYLAAFIGRAFLLAKSYDLAEAWARNALALAEALAPGVPADKRPADTKAALADSHLLLGDLARLRSEGKQGKELADGTATAINEYQKAWDLTQHSVAGNNLAYLLCKQDPVNRGAAYSIVQKLRQSRYSDQLVRGDRLSLGFLDTLGEVYLASEHQREAIDLFKEALAQYKNEPMVYLYLGKAYKALEQTRLAFENLNLAIAAAVAKADAVRDPGRKAEYKKMADEARGLQKEILGAKP
jgi:predicted Zn-dependent protease